MKKEIMDNQQNNFQKMICILTKPTIAFATIQPKISESIFTVLILYLLLAVKGIIELNNLGQQNNTIRLLLGTAVGLCAAWFGLTILFHGIAKLLGGTGRFGTTFLWMGYIAAPMIITSFLSLTIFLTATALIPSIDKAMTDRADMILGWIGMIWSWPGILCYFVLRYGENLSKGKAIGVVLAVLLVTILGWVFPIIFPSLF